MLAKSKERGVKFYLPLPNRSIYLFLKWAPIYKYLHLKMRTTPTLNRFFCNLRGPPRYIRRIKL